MAQPCDSGLSPAAFGAVPAVMVNPLQDKVELPLAAHAAARLAGFCGTFHVPLLSRAW